MLFNLTSEDVDLEWALTLLFVLEIQSCMYVLNEACHFNSWLPTFIILISEVRICMHTQNMCRVHTVSTSRGYWWVCRWGANWGSVCLHRVFLLDFPASNFRLSSSPFACHKLTVFEPMFCLKTFLTKQVIEKNRRVFKIIATELYKRRSTESEHLSA